MQANIQKYAKMQAQNKADSKKRLFYDMIELYCEAKGMTNKAVKKLELTSKMLHFKENPKDVLEPEACSTSSFYGDSLKNYRYQDAFLRYSKYQPNNREYCKISDDFGEYQETQYFRTAAFYYNSVRGIALVPFESYNAFCRWIERESVQSSSSNDKHLWLTKEKEKKIFRLLKNLRITKQKIYHLK